LASLKLLKNSTNLKLEVSFDIENSEIKSKIPSKKCVTNGRLQHPEGSRLDWVLKLKEDYKIICITLYTNSSRPGEATAEKPRFNI
jgi:hypothetical protein